MPYKVRIEDRRQDLEDGLLNQSIHDIGNAKVTLAAIAFRSGLSPRWLRDVGSID